MILLQPNPESSVLESLLDPRTQSTKLPQPESCNEYTDFTRLNIGKYKASMVSTNITANNYLDDDDNLTALYITDDDDVTIKESDRECLDDDSKSFNFREDHILDNIDLDYFMSSYSHGMQSKTINVY